jgi:hypothetical protein
VVFFRPYDSHHQPSSYSLTRRLPTARAGARAHDGIYVNINLIVKGSAMGTQNTGDTGSQSVGVGQGNDSHAPSQRDSGGSGGAQLTRNLEDLNVEAPSTPVDQIAEAPAVAPEGAGSAATAATRGYQDTHSSQAGSTGTGLGAPETGGNQQASDLPPPRK